MRRECHWWGSISYRVAPESLTRRVHLTVRCWERHFQAEGPASVKALIRIPWDFQDGTRRTVCLGISLVTGEVREERGSGARLSTLQTA